jgi:hypothetical protein
VIEGAGSVIIVWRFSGTPTLSETAERRAQKAVAVSFFALAPYICYEAIAQLAGGGAPGWLGIGLAVTSLIIMPFLERRNGVSGDEQHIRVGRRHRGRPAPAAQLLLSRQAHRRAARHRDRQHVQPGCPGAQQRPGQVHAARLPATRRPPRRAAPPGT